MTTPTISAPRSLLVQNINAKVHNSLPIAHLSMDSSLSHVGFTQIATRYIVAKILRLDVGVPPRVPGLGQEIAPAIATLVTTLYFSRLLSGMPEGRLMTRRVVARRRTTDYKTQYFSMRCARCNICATGISVTSAMSCK